jgi:hypothetical protein
MAIKTPQKPTISAAIRYRPTFSRRKIAASTAVINGAEKKIVVALASVMNGKAV